MRKFIFFIGLFCFTGFSSASAFAGSCDGTKAFETEVNFIINKAETKLVNNADRQVFTRKYREDIRAHRDVDEDYVLVPEDPSVTGLFRSGLAFDSKFTMTGRPLDFEGEYYCPHVQRLDVYVDYNATIRIPSEITGNSCRFKALVDHYERHREGHEISLDMYVSELKKAIPKIIKALEHQYVDRDMAVTRMPEDRFKPVKEYGRKLIAPYGEAMYAGMQEFDILFDTRGEYKRVRDFCLNR